MVLDDAVGSSSLAWLYTAVTARNSARPASDPSGKIGMGNNGFINEAMLESTEHSATSSKAQCLSLARSGTIICVCALLAIYMHVRSSESASSPGQVQSSPSS